MISSPKDSPQSEKPLLLVDVDGVISLFDFDPADQPPGTWLTVDGILHLCSAHAAEHLPPLANHFELVWCSGWEEKANDYLPSELGLEGPLPYLQFERSPETTRAHWKLDAIDQYAGAHRPLAWIDDALDAACHQWATERPGPTLLVTTQASEGIDDRHALQLRSWAAQL